MSASPAFSFTIRRNALADALARVSPAIAQRTTLPVLMSVLCELGIDGLKFGATNLDCWISLRVGGDAIQARSGTGVIAIPAKRLQDIVAALPSNAAVTIVVSGKKAKITANRSKFELACLPADEFPTTPAVESKLKATVDGAMLSGALDRALPFAGTQSGVTEEVLRGAHITGGERGLMVECANRAQIARIVVDSAQRLDCDAVLPSPSVQAIRTLFAAEPSVKLDASSTHTKFGVEGAEFITRLLGGQFPALDKLMSLTISYTVTADSKAMMDALKRVLLGTTDNVVVLHPKADSLRITARASAEAAAEEVIDATRTGTVPVKRAGIATNGRMLLSAIKAAESERIAIQLTEQPNAPYYVRPADALDGVTAFAIAPMQLLDKDVLDDESETAQEATQQEAA